MIRSCIYFCFLASISASSFSSCRGGQRTQRKKRSGDALQSNQVQIRVGQTNLLVNLGPSGRLVAVLLGGVGALVGVAVVRSLLLGLLGGSELSAGRSKRRGTRGGEKSDNKETGKGTLVSAVSESGRREGVNGPCWQCSARRWSRGSCGCAPCPPRNGDRPGAACSPHPRRRHRREPRSWRWSTLKSGCAGREKGMTRARSMGETGAERRARSANGMDWRGEGRCTHCLIWEG